MSLLFFLTVSLLSAIKLQNNLHHWSTQIPESNLNTLLSANMALKLPAAPSDKIKATYRNIIASCIPDFDTVYLGIYYNNTDIRIKHVQTSAEGHAEHMANADPAVKAMVAASEGIQALGSDLAGPEILLKHPTLIDLFNSGKMPPPREFMFQSGKKHKLTAINHGQVANLSFVLIDRVIKLPSGLTPQVLEVLENFTAHAEEASTLAEFSISYRAQDETIAFREIYSNHGAVVMFRRRTLATWQTLTHNLGTLIKQEIAGPSEEVAALQNWWEDNEGAAQFFTLYDGFQRVHAQIEVEQ